MTRTFLCICLAALAACSAPVDRLALTPQPSALELRPLVSSVMVRSVSLPSYASAEEIPRALPNGLIATNDDVLWADDPQRAVTLVVSQALGDILNTDVGSEPWPFLGLPDVAIEVRVARMLADADGMFRLSGQFFVGGDGISYRDTTNTFNIEVPMSDQSVGTIATAQAAALVQLSEQIARRLGR